MYHGSKYLNPGLRVLLALPRPHRPLCCGPGLEPSTPLVHKTTARALISRDYISQIRQGLNLCVVLPLPRPHRLPTAAQVVSPPFPVPLVGCDPT